MNHRILFWIYILLQISIYATQDPNCISFNNKKECTMCKEPYYINTKCECIYISDALPHCSSYNNNYIPYYCMSCTYPYYLINNVCITLENCMLVLRYESTNLPIDLYCAKCPMGYLQTRDLQGCLPKVINCTYYADSKYTDTSLVCTGCINTHVLLNNKDCVPSVIKCDTYGPVETLENGGLTAPCLTCLPGYMFTDDNRKCILKVKNCSVYQPTTYDNFYAICTECMPGFVLSTRKACVVPLIENCLTMTGNLCTKCNTGHKLTTNGLGCYFFSPLCGNYTLPSSPLGEGFCTACITNFTLTTDKKECLPKILNCASYYDSVYTQCYHRCKACNIGYALTTDQFSCLAVIVNCVVYVSQPYIQTVST